jgi:proteasome alpha subunit
MKPYECEILVAAVGESPGENELFHILYDGSVSDRSEWVAMGGQTETLSNHLESNYPKDPPALKDAVGLGQAALRSGAEQDIPAANLEVAVLDRTRGRRKFRRLTDQELASLL